MTSCCEEPQFNKEGGEVEKMDVDKHEKPAIAQELWFQEDEKELVAKHSIGATVRAGDRTAKTADLKGGYQEGGFVNLKIQKNDGSFDPLETRVIVYSVVKKMLEEIEPEDLEGTPLLQKTKADLIEKLKRLYGRDFTDNDVVTIVRFEYADNLKEAGDLIRVKTLTYAHEPKENPKNMDIPSYTIPLIEHDYPAKTPVMWNAAYRKFGIDAGNIMLVGDSQSAGHILDVFRKDAKYRGGGAGVGFKNEVITYLDELEPLAKEIGAVNFIMKTPEGKLKGFNTDGIGYAQSLEEVFKQRQEELRGKKAVVLGAGGAGNAVAFALAEKGMRVVILNRTVAKARDLADKINRYFKKMRINETLRFGGEELIAAEIRDADAVINVSTKGSAGELEKYSALAPAVLPASQENIQENLDRTKELLRVIPQDAIISDIVLGKEATPLLKSAKAAGFETLDGIPMVINQGVEAFWLLYDKELQSKNITKEQVAEVMKRAASS
ncbi:MAG: hypothetical protein HYV52_03735 [Parcubacteria group bacterium]|nr:hypothetical protein [Parcubacteria group bacterium]